MWCPVCKDSRPKGTWSCEKHSQTMLVNSPCPLCPIPKSRKPIEPVKHDSGKARWSLIPWDALGLVVGVLSFGAKKYSDDNWKGISVERYESALFRHFAAWKAGETNDEESGLHHLAHMTCCAIFILWLEVCKK